MGDIGNIADAVNTDSNLQSRASGQSIKLEAVNVNNDDIEMDEEGNGGQEDIDEGIHSQDSQTNKAPTLQESVGNVIKSFYQESVVSSCFLAESVNTHEFEQVYILI